MTSATLLISVAVVAVAVIPGMTLGARPSCYSCVDPILEFLLQKPAGSNDPLLEVTVAEGAARVPYCTDGKDEWTKVDTLDDDDTAYRCVQIFYENQERLQARGKMREEDLKSILVPDGKIEVVPADMCTTDFLFESHPDMTGEVCVCSTELCNQRNGAHLGAQASAAMLLLSALVSISRIFA